MIKVFYFGCWGDAGHYIWTPGGRMGGPKAGPWTISDLDAPSYERHTRQGLSASTGRGFVPVDREETQGVWRLTQQDAWTAIGGYDRTQDRRGGSISVFVAEGTYTEEEMRAIAAEHFPVVWDRILRGSQ